MISTKPRSLRLLLLPLGVGAALLLLAVSGFAAQSYPEPAGADLDGFVPIFDGKSLAGWDADPKYWHAEDGMLVGVSTNREVAHYIGEKQSRGCTQASSWREYPFLRMPNVHLEADPKGPTPEEMIADVKDGILIEGTGSFSIDQQRYNGQFGGDAFWEIKNGKKTRMVTDFTYNAITTDFWANLDAVGPQETWEHHGLTGDAKGQPVQSNHPSHGSAPCLIRKIMVGAAYA